MPLIRKEARIRKNSHFVCHNGNITKYDVNNIIHKPPEAKCSGHEVEEMSLIKKGLYRPKACTLLYFWHTSADFLPFLLLTNVFWQDERSMKGLQFYSLWWKALTFSKMEIKMDIYDEGPCQLGNPYCSGTAISSASCNGSPRKWCREYNNSP